MDIFQEINQHKYLFLDRIVEPQDNFLEIYINAGIVSRIAEDVIIGKINIGPARAIKVTNESARYKIFFEQAIVAYNITNESFAPYKEKDAWTGELARGYSKSTYLDYILENTIANSIFPDELKHYGFVCQNHVIDIIAFSAPIVKRQEL